MSVAQDKQDRAALAIAAMISEFKIGRYDLLRSRLPGHVKCRRIAIERLHDLGLGHDAIAKAMGINPSTARYWLNANHRASSNAASTKARLRRKHIVRLGSQKVLQASS